MSSSCCKVLLCTFAVTWIFSPQSTEGASDCKSALGMQSKGIPNANISASSTLSRNHVPAFARLDERKGAWCSAPNDNSPYVQILLDEEKLITKVVTQGSYMDLIWATKYQIKYLKEGKWSTYQKADGSQTFEGNRGSHSLNDINLQPPIRTSSIRIYPMVPLSVMLNEYNVVCLRLELYGCNVPSCGPPNIPVNSELRGSNKTSYKYSDKVLLGCKPGYFARGNRLQTCGLKGWIGSSFTCSPKRCGNPGIPQNGKLKSYNFTFKRRVYFECNHGYKLVGEKYLQCQANQTWSGTLPTCEPIDCGVLPIPDKTEKIMETHTRVGGVVRFQCKEKGFEISGSEIRTCQNNGLWSGFPTSCKIISCGDPGTPFNGKQANVKNGYNYGGSVEFTCKDNYTLSGASKIYCEETKDWSSPIPRCWAPCPDPGVPGNGIRIGDDFRHNKSVTFKCQDGIELKGVATIDCYDGTWTDDIPQCKDSSYASCKDIYQSGKSRGNTAYMLQTGVGKVPVYCHVTSIGACGGGGWTLVMKIDGHKSTFHYDSNLWTNKNDFNRPGGKTGFDNVQTKLPTYWSTPFSKICLAMKIGHKINTIVINRNANSLYSLIADGHYRPTSLGRDTWKSLIGSQGSLQRNCNREGFNVVPDRSDHSKARIGIMANQENDCTSCDSRIGFGTGGKHDDSNTCGNQATHSPDNGDKHIKAMGYILVQ